MNWEVLSWKGTVTRSSEKGSGAFARELDGKYGQGGNKGELKEKEKRKD